MEIVEGDAKSFIFRSDNNEFGVLVLNTDFGEITVRGAVCNAIEGQSVTCKGRWEDHPKFGEQFNVVGTHTRPPTSRKGIIGFLSSGFIKGIGPKFAQKLYDHLGADTLEVIRTDPQRVTSIPGIGSKRAKELSERAHQELGKQAISVWLFDHGISSNLVKKIYKQYGNNAVQVLEDNPYILIDEMYGVGFRTADDIALNIGIPLDHAKRLNAGLLWTLDGMEKTGHTACVDGDLIARAAENLSAGHVENIEQRLSETLTQLESENRLKIIKSGKYGAMMVQTPRSFFGEKNIAITLVNWYASDFEVGDARSILKSAVDAAGLTQDESQIKAAQSLLNNRFGVLTGRPGTGKTATLRVLLAAFDHLGLTCELASPTGKAARRMSEATGRDARTIHRLLEFDPASGGFIRDKSWPLECDALVVDEASMLDTHLMSSICTALGSHTRLILVGDNNQLPSVGAGRILGDIIDSNKVCVNELTRIHRQAEGSAIVTNAHAIIEGRVNDIDEGGEAIEDSDFRYINFGPGAKIAAALPTTVLDKIAPKLGVTDPINDIQVLTGTHGGPVGTQALNEALGKAMNPAPSTTMSHKGVTFGVGDKVIVTRNNYDLDVFNGMLGMVVDVVSVTDDAGKERHGLTVQIEGGHDVVFVGTDLDDLKHAWALTVHKTQGSEFPVTVLILDGSQSIMLERNWIYTAVTRASEYCIVIGQRKWLNQAVNRTRAEKRITLLDERI